MTLIVVNWTDILDDLMANPHVFCVHNVRFLAQMRSADHVTQCPSSEAKRMTFTRGEYFAFWTHLGPLELASLSLCDPILFTMWPCFGQDCTKSLAAGRPDG